MKHIKRFLLFLFALIVSSIFINANSRFFKDIGTYIPYLESRHPEIVRQISEYSDTVNEYISHLPTIPELIANLRNIELPIDPDDVAANVYHSSDTMLTFNNNQNISVSTDGSEIDVYGLLSSPQDKYIVYRFLSENGDVLKQYTDCTDSEGKFRKIMYIPDGTFQFAVFTGPQMVGNYSGLVYNYIYLTRDEQGAYSISKSPVYQHNITEYEKNKSLSTALKSTYAICADEPGIKSLAYEITAACTTDYEKALALHDWVCSNICYDSDSISADSNSAPYVASDVLETRRGVCLGYSNLYAALCRAVGIPCNVVTGYALGVTEAETVWNDTNLYSTDANHAWNEVHIDNRWIIVDTTWDSRNIIENGIQQTEGYISHIYFDANIQFFSTNHKIFEYVRR